MKKLCTVVFVFVLGFNVFAQNKENSSPELREASKFSTEAVKFFQQKKFKEALLPAQKAAAIYEKELGADNIEVARAQRNLGYINYYLDNKKETQKAFERSLEIYEKQPKLNNDEGLSLAGMLEVLAIIKFENNKTGTTQDLLEKTIAVYEKYGEGQSAKAAQAWIGLGNIKLSEENYASAAESYEKSLAIKSRTLGKDEFETTDVFNRCLCALKKADKEKEIERVHQTYFPDLELTEVGTLKRKKKENEKENQKPANEDIPDDGKTLVAIPLNGFVDKGIVNGKALSLPKPGYPASARSAGAEGTVKVSVTIDEEGKVIFACGAFNKTHQALRQASEIAAYGARFEPTLLNGKPIKVSGVVVYNFVR